ncbi:MAG TPA: ATP-binding protein [Usitatibacter sp.]|nr:ATP-binding protein [Usitatibacter sp.]
MVSRLPPDFLAGGGEMGERMRDMDWTRSSLGPARDWPQGLKIALRIALASPQPMAVLWGASHALFFNDACRAVLGDRHMVMLAQPAVTAWSDFWQAAGHRVELALQRNEGSAMEGMRLAAGYNVVFSPLPGDAGAVGGVLCLFTEIASPIGNEQRYRDLVQTLPAAVYITDAQGYIGLYNDAAVRLWGRCPVAGEKWCGAHRIFTPEGRPVTLEGSAMARAVRLGEEVHDAEIVIERPDGTRAHAIAHPRPLFDSAGKVVGAINMLVDITEHIAGEAELAITKDQLADQVDSLTRLHNLAMRLGGMTQLQPALQAVLDTAVEAQHAHFGIVWMHDAATQMLLPRASHGFDENTLANFEGVAPGPSGGGAGNAYASRSRWAIEDTETDESFEPFRDAARRAGLRALHSTPIVTRSGELLGVLSVHYRQPRVPTQRDMQIADVCARHAADAVEARRSHEAVERGERIYRAIGESLDYGVWTAGREGRVTYVSESFLNLLGCTVADWTGQDWQRFVHPEDAANLLADWKECVRAGRNWDRELRVRGADRKWHSVLQRAVPMHDERGEVSGWAGIHLDIGRLKQVENELRELDKRKNEFLATLAHELRNPLAPLRNGIEVLRIARDNAPMTEKARAMMERQLHQMVRLVDDLLDVSRVSRGKIELRRDNVELASVLRNAIETSHPLMSERGHELVANVPTDKIVVYADMTRLSQVFWNLLNNAAKYTDVGGRIELDVEMRGGNVEVTVKDNGIGIPGDMLSQVFDIFTQVDRSLEKAQGGLGIGLSIARRLVEMHGGKIDVRSEGHGMGSTFTVTLPAAVVPPQAEIPSGAAAPAGVTAMACKRILIADDNADSATTLSIMLEMLGNEVRIAHDGEQAVRAAREFKPDAILLDIGMPKLNGYDACAQLRGFPETAAAFMVALTGWGQEEDKARARAAGFDHHIVKPVEPSALEALIAGIPRR